MMMEREALLVFFCLVMSGSAVYPSIRFGQRDMSILMTSDPEQVLESVSEEESNIPLTQQAELRSLRHADAIFSNSYRKVLGQIYARKVLQTIMGKRLRQKTERYVKRQTDIYKGTYKQDLTSIQREQSYSGQHKNIK